MHECKESTHYTPIFRLTISQIDQNIQVKCQSLPHTDIIKSTYPSGVENGYEDLWISLIEHQQVMFTRMIKNKHQH